MAGIDEEGTFRAWDNAKTVAKSKKEAAPKNSVEERAADKKATAEAEKKLEAAKKAQDLDRKLVKEQTESYVSKLKEAGMRITTPDLKSFQNATSGVLGVFTDIYGEALLTKLKAAVAK